MILEWQRVILPILISLSKVDQAIIFSAHAVGASFLRQAAWRISILVRNAVDKISDIKVIIKMNLLSKLDS